MNTTGQMSNSFVANKSFLAACPFAPVDFKMQDKPELIPCPAKADAACPQTGSLCEYANSSHNTPMIYGDYLMLDKLLSCQQPATRRLNREVHDEHLFIVTHQTYELWFKQILYELDSVRDIIKDIIKTGNNKQQDRYMLVSQRLNRIVLILKLLVDQWTILESMTPPDFAEFRSFLKPASGFQSIQFRLLENKLGIRNELRVKYSRNNYLQVFKDKNTINSILSSENEPSLSELVQGWLEMLPETDQFFSRYRLGIQKMLRQQKQQAEAETDPVVRQQLFEQVSKKEQLFEQLTSEQRYEQLRSRGDRRFSYRAFLSALQINVQRHRPENGLMFQILNNLQDIDTMLNKWRANHVHVVLKMIGPQLNGTGGSSGYQYLRATLTDRYKIFVDLFDLSSFILPYEYLED